MALLQSNASPDYISLVKALLEVDPALRLTVTEAAAQPCWDQSADMPSAGGFPPRPAAVGPTPLPWSRMSRVPGAESVYWDKSLAPLCTTASGSTHR